MSAENVALEYPPTLPCRPTVRLEHFTHLRVSAVLRTLAVRIWMERSRGGYRIQRENRGHFVIRNTEGATDIARVADAFRRCGWDVEEVPAKDCVRLRKPTA